LCIVNNIHNETIRLNSLASSFLDLARLESGRVQFRKTLFSVADLLYECKDVMASKATEDNIQIRVESPEGLPLLDADRDKVKQVILNLLSNAIKYNRPNGMVMLRAEASEKELAIYIQDTGLGIPDESLPHLFEKFFRVREHESRVAGTGLGLSICKQIIHGHGGRIEVRSKIGVGTVFLVSLPRVSKTQQRAEEIENKQSKKKH
jgi:signal transduction histidine kinase